MRPLCVVYCGYARLLYKSWTRMPLTMCIPRFAANELPFRYRVRVYASRPCVNQRCSKRTSTLSRPQYTPSADGPLSKGGYSSTGAPQRHQSIAGKLIYYRDYNDCKRFCSCAQV